MTAADFGLERPDLARAIDHPVVVLECDDGIERPVPAALPAVVVVTAAGRPGIGPIVGADVALTTSPDPPRPWVTVEDLDSAVELLGERVRSSPQAALAFAQVLRLTEGLGVEEALVLESMAYSVLQAGPEFARWRAGRSPRAPRPVTGDEVLVDRRGDRLLVSLNRPQVHNAYNARMRDLLCEALAVAVADPSCRVELRGNGPSFGSGGDLDEFGTAPDPATAHLVRTARSPARLLAAVADRVHAHLHGVCAGSGIELPAFAGRVTAEPTTRIWLPELAMGLIPGAGGTASLSRRLGRHRTAWMGLTGAEIDGETARSWGLVDRLSGESE